MLNAALLPPGERVLAAVSGGTDSLALLALLHEQSTALGIRLAAGHVHHGLRGPAAEEDAAWLAAWCRRRGIPFLLRRVEVPALARAARRNLEAAARTARYQALHELARALRCSRVAVAHTADDQLETLLFRLLRGSAAPELAGMPARRPLLATDPTVELVRPLLEATRAQTAAVCAERGLAPRHDATNDDPRQLRHRLRTQLLPALEAVDPGARARLLESRRRLEEDAAALRAAASALLAAATLPPAPGEAAPALEADLLCAAAPAVARRAVHAYLGALGIAGREAGAPAAALLRLAAGAVPSLLLPGGTLQAARCGRRLVLRRRTPEPPLPVVPPVPVALPGRTRAPGLALVLELHPAGAPLCPALSPTEALLPAAALVPPLCLRPPLPGDRLRPLGAPGSRLLSDLFTDRHVPRHRRACWPLLCDADGILWIPGLALSERARLLPGGGACLRARALPEPGAAWLPPP